MRTMWTGLVALSLAVALTSLCGCEEEKKGCKTAKECPKGYACVSGKCIAQKLDTGPVEASVADAPQPDAPPKVPDKGLDKGPDKPKVKADAPPYTCHQVLGKLCTLGGGQCLGGNTCNLTSSTSGFCTCTCTPTAKATDSKPATVDDCPGQPMYGCTNTAPTGAPATYFCMPK